MLHDALGTEIQNCFVLHGRLSRKQRASVLSELESLDADAPRILLATGRLISEGFDHPPLDTFRIPDSIKLSIFRLFSNSLYRSVLVLRLKLAQWEFISTASNLSWDYSLTIDQYWSERSRRLL